MKSLVEFILESNNTKYSPLGKLASVSFNNAGQVVSCLHNIKKDLFDELKKKYNNDDYKEASFGFWSKISGKEKKDWTTNFKITNYGNKKVDNNSWEESGILLNYILDNIDDLEKIKSEFSKCLDINLESKGSSNMLELKDKDLSKCFIKFKFKK